MKKIIKNTMTEPRETTCEECGSIFSFTYEDIECEDAMFGFSKIRIVRCPVCKCGNGLIKINVKNEGETNVERRDL